MSEKNKRALPSGAQMKIGPSARCECPLFFGSFDRVDDFTSSARALLSLFYDIFGLDTLVVHMFRVFEYD